MMPDFVRCDCCGGFLFRERSAAVACSGYPRCRSPCVVFWREIPMIPDIFVNDGPAANRSFIHDYT